MNDTTRLLTGAFEPGAPALAAPRRGHSAFLPIILVVWLLVGLGYAGFHFMTKKEPAVEATPQAQVASPVVVHSTNTEELSHRLDAVMDKTEIAAASLRRAEGQILESLPAVRQNGLLVETRRLEGALAVIEAARRDLEQNRDNLERISSSIKEIK